MPVGRQLYLRNAGLIQSDLPVIMPLSFRPASSRAVSRWFRPWTLTLRHAVFRNSLPLRATVAIMSRDPILIDGSHAGFIRILLNDT
ncbi:hypothetical protein RSOLAG1IB_06064 [Rhizoctonia solani AG-1 IB]|uniref:Uncharacterized protein n=1 Tax=Thanatephorus cucumeris (strain AG1-IB / isolate 7/3/14) TaxID=1108050 RepID=A0A0B7F4J6_THACB|nr:hypothetical protein RSOLAG1IB_06064 [Rhizoctonia solani AG-1 IB]